VPGGTASKVPQIAAKKITVLLQLLNFLCRLHKNEVEAITPLPRKWPMAKALVFRVIRLKK
jgi:hypothetical protein